MEDSLGKELRSRSEKKNLGVIKKPLNPVNNFAKETFPVKSKYGDLHIKKTISDYKNKELKEPNLYVNKDSSKIMQEIDELGNTGAKRT